MNGCPDELMQVEGLSSKMCHLKLLLLSLCQGQT